MEVNILTERELVYRGSDTPLEKIVEIPTEREVVYYKSSDPKADCDNFVDMYEEDYVLEDEVGINLPPVSKCPTKYFAVENLFGELEYEYLKEKAQENLGIKETLSKVSSILKFDGILNESVLLQQGVGNEIIFYIIENKFISKTGNNYYLDVPKEYVELTINKIYIYDSQTYIYNRNTLVSTIKLLSDDLLAESSANTDSFNRIQAQHNEFVLETNRKNNELATAITTEVAKEQQRAIVVENTLSEAIVTEVQRATEAEQVLHESLLAESAANIDAFNLVQSRHDELVLEVNQKQSELQTAITAETNRATAAEQELRKQIEQKQDKLVSGTNIKTINGQSILGEGDINIQSTEGGTLVEIVNNLTDGGADSALSAEMGKRLNTELNDLNSVVYGGAEVDLLLEEMPYRAGIYLDKNGNEVVLNNEETAKYWRVTEYVEIVSSGTISDVVVYHNNLVSPIVFYDKEKKVLETWVTSGGYNGEKITAETVAIPNDAVFFRVCYQQEPSIGINFTDNRLIFSQNSGEGLIAAISKSDNLLSNLVDWVGYTESTGDSVGTTVEIEHDIVSGSTTPVYKNDGTTATYDAWACSSLIALPNGVKRIFGTVTGYNRSGIVLPGLVFFDENRNYLSSISPTTSVNSAFETQKIDITDIPNGAKYIAVQGQTDDRDGSINVISVSITLDENPTIPLVKRVLKANHPLDGLNILCLGDSITNGDYGSDPEGTANDHEENYPYFLKKKYGGNIYNHGRNGGTALSCWNNVVKYIDLETIQPDIVLIMFGANGAITDTLSQDVEPYSHYEDYSSTQTGSMCKIIEYIYEQMEYNVAIYLCTPPPAGVKRQAYRDRIINSQSGVKSIAERYRLPLIDVYKEAGFSDFTQDIMQPIDNLHFGKIGYSRLGTFIGSQLISKLTIDL